jgi:hypothetical protein
MLLLVVVLIADSQPKTAGERQQIARAEEQCQRANKDAINLRYKEALDAFEESLRAFSAAPLSDAERATAWDCAIKWGAAATDADKAGDAATAFALAMLLEPQREPSTKSFNPKVTAAFQKARQKRRQNQTSGLTVTGTPAGAEVWIDARFAGASPISLSKLTAGVHWLLVRAQGYESFSTPLTLKPNDAYRAEAFLKGPPVAASAPVVVKPVVVKPVAAQPVLIVPPPPPKSAGVHPGLSWLPLGIPQFLERRYAVGAILLATQVALVALNAALYAITSRDKAADGFYDHPERSEAMKWVVNASFIAVGADMIAGGIDGIVHRDD